MLTVDDSRELIGPFMEWKAAADAEDIKKIIQKFWASPRSGA
jgi:hypothetical protein